MLGNIAELSIRLVDVSTERLQAVFLLSEGIEGVKTIRDRGWAENMAPLVPGTTYYLQFDTQKNEWATTTAVQIIDGVFTRSFVLGEVGRDANDDIVSSGGTVDPNTRRVDMTVSWSNRGRAYAESISTYITDLFNN